MSSTISIGARLRQLARSAPERLAVTDATRTLTRQELDRRSNQIARGLRVAGVKFGDLVSVGLPNSVGFVEVCYALWKLGATPQPLSFRLPLVETNAITQLAQSPILVAESTMQSDRPRYDVDELLALSDDGSDLEDLISPCLKAPTSGGSTGQPKLILAAQSGVFRLDQPAPFGIGENDVAVIPAPLYYNGPFVAATAAINQGAHVVLLPRFDALETLRTLERHRGTWIYMVPTMMSRIWKLGPQVRGAHDLSALRAVWHMAAPCPAWLKRAWIEWLGPDAIMELYSGTESQASTVISGREWLEKPGSVGRVARGEIKIVGPGGESLPAGQIGEVYLRPPDPSQATYRYRGAEARALAGGWESIGDIGYLDADGYLFLADRRTDLILVGGANVYPAEVEAAIDSHPLVESSAVIGLPDEEMGAYVHAIVKSRGALSEAALREHMKARLAPYKTPCSYEFVAESLRDDGGKVRRSQLREARLASAEARRAGAGRPA